MSALAQVSNNPTIKLWMYKEAYKVKWILGQKKTESQVSGLVSIQMTHQSIALAYALAEKPANIPHFGAEYYEKLGDFTPEIRNFVEKNNLKGLSCSIVVPEQDYSLNLVDTPNVAQEEMDRALQWLVREYINFPMTDAVMDAFQLPLPRARDNAKMSYVAVIRKNIIPKLEGTLKSTGLSLKYIDIPELVLRNIAVLHPAESKGVIFIYLHPWGGKLILCRQGIIFMARSIDFRLEPLNQNAVLDDATKPLLEFISLEIQRSLDYASTTFRQTVAASILLSPTVLNQELIASYLKSNTGMEVHAMDLTAVLNLDQPLTKEKQAQCLMAIGGVLRSDSGLDLGNAAAIAAKRKEVQEVKKVSEQVKTTNDAGQNK